MSLPSRGAWIEIQIRANVACQAEGRSPHGERGLKSYQVSRNLRRLESLPSRGAWIEMQMSGFEDARLLESLPSRGAWIEILRVSP